MYICCIYIINESTEWEQFPAGGEIRVGVCPKFRVFVINTKYNIDGLVTPSQALTTMTLPKMFADDTTITISGSSLADLRRETNLELLNLHCWLRANKLSLNVAKTEFMVIGSRQKLLAESHNEINIKLEDQVISNVDHAKSLGFIIDNRLSWSNHVNELCKKVTSAIGALRRIRPLISQSTAVLA